MVKSLVTEAVDEAEVNGKALIDGEGKSSLPYLSYRIQKNNLL